jgi:hypothetical protein
MRRGWHPGHRKRGAGRVLPDIGRPNDRELVWGDRKTQQLIGRKLSSVSDRFEKPPLDAQNTIIHRRQKHVF